MIFGQFNMEALQIVSLIVLMLTLAFVVGVALKVYGAPKHDQMAQIMNQNINKINDRLTEAAKYIGSLGQELRSMQSIGKNIEDLRLAFFSPKLRGNFGERVLYDALENHFPHDHFDVQHKFKDGRVVDAVVKTKDGLIPIDSKFPVDNFRKMAAAQTDAEREFESNEFRKAVRKHIGDIAKKYILPEEGTISFAVMYVPSEAIYYEIISSTDELSELAEKNKVLMVSPNTLTYFLHILRMGFERIRIEENAQKVWEMLAGFHQETLKFGENLGVLARHVTQSKSSMDSVTAEYGKLALKVEQIKQLK